MNHYQPVANQLNICTHRQNKNQQNRIYLNINRLPIHLNLISTLMILRIWTHLNINHLPFKLSLTSTRMRQQLLHSDVLLMWKIFYIKQGSRYIMFLKNTISESTINLVPAICIFYKKMFPIILDWGLIVNGHRFIHIKDDSTIKCDIPCVTLSWFNIELNFPKSNSQ